MKAPFHGVIAILSLLVVASAPTKASVSQERNVSLHENYDEIQHTLPISIPESRPFDYPSRGGALSWLQDGTVLGEYLPFANVEIIRWKPSNPTTSIFVKGHQNNENHQNNNQQVPIPQEEQQHYNSLVSPQTERRRLQETTASTTILDEYSGSSGGEDDLIVVVTFRDIYKVILFIAVAWFLGELSVYVGLPSLVGEIAAGFLLGPPLADFVPYPGALVLTGNIGLIGLILESGIALDVDQLREVGHRALLLAIVGSALPLLTGFGVGRWIGKDVKAAIAVGAAFAPSSLGVASNSLNSGDVLNTPIGQMIVASSVFDDVFGLILLSILEVFADPNPTTFDYILPFIASFGYLIVLGLLGITVLPRLLEKRVLPLVSEDKRDQFAMVLLMLFTVCYMLTLNYSGSSYLTGVFLAGLTFSQLHGVHASFVKNGKPLLDWLLRIFFAATIGFQVPITRFKDPFVLKWGSALLLAVFAKVPIGLCVPRFHGKKADDFPYNPYLRDVLITALAMTCRGEFNVIVASYALSEGLFHPDEYSAVILAILFGSIVSPLVLTKVLQYYNDLTNKYLAGKHEIQRIGNTCDGYRPLFLAIQARTPVRWNLQEAFKRKLEENGLIIIDHRSWHTLGRQDIGEEAVDVTEVFVQDTKMRVRVNGCFGPNSRRKAEDPSSKTAPDNASDSSDNKDSLEITETSHTETSNPLACIEEAMKEEEEVEARCEEVKQLLSECFKSDDPDDYVIQVSQWRAFIVEKNPPSVSSDKYKNESTSTREAANRKRFYSFQSHDFDFEAITAEDSKEAVPPVEVETPPPMPPRSFLRRSSSGAAGDQTSGSFFRRSVSAISGQHSTPLHPVEDGPKLGREDLWETDNACHNACREGFTLTPDHHGHDMRSITAGLGEDATRPTPRMRSRHNRNASFDFNILTSPNISERDKETSVIRDRLCGYVRHHETVLPSHSEALSPLEEE